MCQKPNTLKHFFVLLNHPKPLQKSLVLGVMKQTPLSKELFEQSRNQIFLQPNQIQSLGFKPPKECQAYLVPIQIPKDWLLH